MVSIPYIEYLGISTVNWIHVVSAMVENYQALFFGLNVSTHLKNMLVKLDNFPRDRGEHIKYLKFQHLHKLSIP